MQVDLNTPQGAPARTARTNFGMVPRGIALDSEIGKSALALRVFIWFAASADPKTGLVRGRPSSAARALRVKANRVSEAITLLEERGALERIPQPAGRFLYRVNFDFVPPATVPLGRRSDADLGYPPDQVRTMTPAAAHAAIGAGVPVQRNTPSGTAEHTPSGTAESYLHTTSRSYPSSEPGVRFDEGAQKSLPLVRVIDGGKTREGRPALSEEVIAQQFAEFWKRYPESDRKVAPSKCLKLYRDILARGAATPEALLAGAVHYAGTVDPKFICTPYRWLTEERWLVTAAAPPRRRLAPETVEEARKYFDD